METRFGTVSEFIKVVTNDVIFSNPIRIRPKLEIKQIKSIHVKIKKTINKSMFILFGNKIIISKYKGTKKRTILVTFYFRQLLHF